MNGIYRNLTVGFNDSNGIFTVSTKQFNTEFYVVVGLLNTDGTQYEITEGTIVRVRELKSNGAQVLDHECVTIANNIITIKCTEQMLASAGLNKFEIVLSETVSEVTSKLTTWHFNVRVEALVHDDSNIESMDECDELIALLNQSTTLFQSFNAHMANMSNPHGMTKEQLSLGNVDNTSDLSKPISTATQSALDLKLDSNLKGAINGVPDLDANGKVPISQTYSSLDDVLEGTANGITVNTSTGSQTATGFKLTGQTENCVPEDGKIYIDITTNIEYRWSGSIYVTIGSPIALGETISTAYRGDRGKIAYDHTLDNTIHTTPDDKTKWNGYDATTFITEPATFTNITSGTSLATIFGNLKSWFTKITALNTKVGTATLTTTAQNLSEAVNGLNESLSTKVDAAPVGLDFTWSTTEAKAVSSLRMGNQVNIRGYVRCLAGSTYPLTVASIGDHKPVGQPARSVSIVSTGTSTYSGQISFAGILTNGNVVIETAPKQDAFCFFDFNYISG